jgi:conjugative transfer pilus assembly protein TraH
MALCSMSPDLCDLLKYLQDQASKMNNLNINSCQAAEGIVTAAGSMLTDKTQEKEGKTAGASLNMFGDVFESWDEWKKSQHHGQEVSARRPRTRRRGIGSFSIRATSCGDRYPVSSGVTDETRELLMSLTGTIIVTPPGENADEKAKWAYLPGGKLTFRQFVGDGGSATVNLPGLKCGADTAECMTPTFSESAFTVTPFSRQVRTRIAAMRDKIINRDATGQTSLDTALIGNSSCRSGRCSRYPAVSLAVTGSPKTTPN